MERKRTVIFVGSIFDSERNAVSSLAVPSRLNVQYFDDLVVLLEQLNPELVNVVGIIASGRFAESDMLKAAAIQFSASEEDPDILYLGEEINEENLVGISKFFVQLRERH